VVFLGETTAELADMQLFSERVMPARRQFARMIVALSSSQL
jgi:hypothetical protein